MGPSIETEKTRERDMYNGSAVANGYASRPKFSQEQRFFWETHRCHIVANGRAKADFRQKCIRNDVYGV